MNPPTFFPSEPLQFCYQRNRLYGDFAYGIGGLVFVLGILFGLQALWWVNVICGGLSLLFAAYIRHSWEKCTQTITVSDTSIATDERCIAWDSITTLKLRYYGRRKYVGSAKGFFELTIIGDSQKIKLDSKLLGFKDLIELLVLVREHYGIMLDGDSLHNFDVLVDRKSC